MVKTHYVLVVVLFFTMMFPGFSYLGKAQANLTSGFTTDDQNPTFSPDGRFILFDSKRNGGGSNLNIWKMDLNGANPVALTSGSYDNIHMPGNSWNATTNKICFSSDRSGNDEIWVMNADGTNPTQITNNPAQDWEPTFSPDGRWIVFQSNRDGNWEIYKVNIQSLQVTRLTTNSADDWEPNWSPTGDKIVFQSFRDGNWEIYTMDTAGSHLINETHDLAEDTDPSWSPDGSKILYSTNYGGMSTANVFVRDTGSLSAPRRLSFASAYDGAPSFSPDGSMVAFESDRSGNLDIWLLSLPLGISPNLNESDTFMNFHIYPNPTSGRFAITGIGNSGVDKIEVYDILGRQVYSFVPTISLSQYPLDLSDQPKGLYSVKIQGKTKFLNTKVIIE